MFLGFFLYWAFGYLDPKIPLVPGQWKNFVNPLNQSFFFIGGFLLGYFFEHVKVSNNIAVPVGFFGAGVFSFIAGREDAIVYLTGLNRIMYTFCAFCICFGVYKLKFRFPNVIHKPLTMVGELSYAIYLIHPIIWQLARHITSDKTWRFILVVVITLATSYILYVYIKRVYIWAIHGRKKSVEDV